jgi:hypothetical protein
MPQHERVIMRAIVCNLLAALLLVHALVGCCRHHDPSAARHEWIESAHTTAMACCHHRRNCDADETKQPPTPCDCKLECKAQCVYLQPEKRVVDAGGMILPIDIAVVKDCSWANVATDAAATSSFWEYSRACDDTEPPVRLHLLHQIILV